MENNEKVLGIFRCKEELFIVFGYFLFSTLILIFNLLNKYLIAMFWFGSAIGIIIEDYILIKMGKLKIEK